MPFSFPPASSTDSNSTSSSPSLPLNTEPRASLPLKHFQVLRFLFTEINYGGRVTDDKDRRLINNLVDTFVGPDVLNGGYK